MIYLLKGIIIMKNVKKDGDFMKAYLRWPLFMILLLLIMSFITFFFDKGACFIILIFTFFSIILLIYIYIKERKHILKNIIKFSFSVNNAMSKFFEEIDIAYMVLDETGKILWKNKNLDLEIKENISKYYTINDIFPAINIREVLAGYGKDYYSLGEKKYNIDIKEGFFDNNKILIAYLYDKTELVDAIKQMENSKPVIGIIYLDNYDEVMENIEEVRRSLLDALVDRKINQYFIGYDAIVKKLEKDRYVFFVQNSNLIKLEEAKFDILEEIKSVSIGNDIRMSLSIGVGIGAEAYIQNYEYARLGLDMALGRGGDQAVVKNGETIRYFGGKSKTVEKNTRVKARVKAQALRELMATKDRVIIMGHKNMDIDVLGSAIGIWRIATYFNKKAHIAMGETNFSLKPIIEMFKNQDYPEDIFLSADKIKSIIDDNSMVVVVDVNRPSITEVPELLKILKTIVVLDHHRQSSEIIDNAVLSYVEPYASSACEMVAEIVQYISDDIKLKQAEVDAMYAGIVVDTLNFRNQTGVRTFEAAVFLKRKGADITRVRKIFRDRFDNCQAKARIIDAGEIFMKEYAISTFDSKNIDSPTVVGAQAANALLDVVGIKASFVITSYNGIIYISARSIDELNVQLVMERLGGGGHRTVAGAQLSNITIEQAKEQLKETLKDMIEKGDI